MSIDPWDWEQEYEREQAYREELRGLDEWLENELKADIHLPKEGEDDLC